MEAKQKSSQPVVRLHDCGQDFPHLRGVTGIDHYSTRALLLPGEVFVPEKGDNRELFTLLKDYRTAGLNGTWATPVPINGTGIYGAISQNIHLRTGFVFRVKNGYKIDFFSSSHGAEEFLRRLGFGWEVSINPTPFTAETWGRKDSLRSMAEGGGYSNLFPAHDILQKPEFHFVVEKMGNLMSSSVVADGVVVKVPNAASTEGMAFLRKGRPLNELPWESVRVMNPDKVIVEAAYEHYPFSLVYEIKEGGVWLSSWSLQMLDHVPIGDLVTFDRIEQGIAHRGNIVGSDHQDLGPISSSVATQADKSVRRLMELARQTGYRGFIGVDLLLRPNGEFFVLECNARTSNSMYTASVQRKVAPNFGGEAVVVMGNIITPPWVADYGVARQAVGDLLYRGGGDPGVLFYNVPLLSLGLQKTGLIGIGRDYDQAVQVFLEAEAKLAD